MFKSGGMANSTSGMMFDPHWQNCKVVDIYLTTNELRVVNQKGVYGILRMHQCQLIERKEETMFEVGKKYVKGKQMIATCLFHDDSHTIMRWDNNNHVNVLKPEQIDPFEWDEYKEPKIHVNEMTVCISPHGKMYTDGVLDVIGKIRITYVEGSGLTVNVLS